MSITQKPPEGNIFYLTFIVKTVIIYDFSERYSYPPAYSFSILRIITADIREQRKIQFIHLGLF